MIFCYFSGDMYLSFGIYDKFSLNSFVCAGTELKF